MGAEVPQSAGQGRERRGAREPPGWPSRRRSATGRGLGSEVLNRVSGSVIFGVEVSLWEKLWHSFQLYQGKAELLSLAEKRHRMQNGFDDAELKVQSSVGALENH